MRVRMTRKARLVTEEAASIFWQQGFDEGVKRTMDASSSTFGEQLKRVRKEEWEKTLAFLGETCVEHGAEGYTGGNNRLRKECPRCWAALSIVGEV